MTASFFALYRTPDDPAEFEQHYFGTHVPLVERTPGLVENRVHRVTRQLVGKPAYHLLAELVFESPEAMKEAFGTPEWAAAGEDLSSWGGMDLVTMFTAAPHAAGEPDPSAAEPGEQ
ncbi:EthD family reductase [Modestobacter sp. NPDC049651]|uniref:EthD family reductase n=1 Tax=unclassified Modestobacter TaxID=2643866 RepID=UPI0033D5882D